MNKIVVIGGGTMGLDIANVFARTGHTVIVREINQELADKACARLDASLTKLVAKGKLDEAQKSAILSAITFTTDITLAADADLVIEAAVEKLEIKQRIFAELDELCKPETIFATNTSSISISDIAASTRRPGQFIGMHFFNPATLMKLVELIRGVHTSQQTFDTIAQLCTHIGKEAVEVADSPGFVVNRVLIPMINEAVGLLEAGVASAKGIDTAMRLGANHPIGPLALGDLIGLDVCLAIMDTIRSQTGNTKYEAAPLLRKMVADGLLGRKTGKGFFDYNK